MNYLDPKCPRRDFRGESGANEEENPRGSGEMRTSVSITFRAHYGNFGWLADGRRSGRPKLATSGTGTISCTRLG